MFPQLHVPCNTIISTSSLIPQLLPFHHPNSTHIAFLFEEERLDSLSLWKLEREEEERSSGFSERVRASTYCYSDITDLYRSDKYRTILPPLIFRSMRPPSIT